MKLIKKFQDGKKFSNTPTGRAMQRQYDLEHGIAMQKVLPEVEVFPNYYNIDNNGYSNSFAIPLERRPTIFSLGEMSQPYVPKKLDELGWLSRTFGINNFGLGIMELIGNPANVVPTGKTIQGIKALTSAGNKVKNVGQTVSKVKRAYNKPNADIIPVEGNITTSDVPVITTENSTSITPELWTAAQDAAVSRGDWDEVYRLNDLHFRTKASEIGIPLTSDNDKLLRLYRGSQKDENVFTSWSSDNPTWATTDKHYAINYTRPRLYDTDGTIKLLRSDPNKVKNLYGVYSKKVGPIENLDNVKVLEIMLKDNFDTNLVFGHDYKVDHSKITGFNDSNGIEYAFKSPTLLKSADPITYDNFGKRIGLGDRHNFNNPDIRWGLFPWMFGGTIGYNYLNQDDTSSKYTNGGKINKT